MNDYSHAAAEPALRDANAADFPRIVALNAVEVRQTSAMDLDRLRFLHGLASYHRVAVVDGEVVAFLLAFAHGAAYPNPNFEWFAARYPSFVYVDRVVVDAAANGRGIGSLLYRDLFEHAEGLKAEVVTCEFNIVPPNEDSARFHSRHGFVEVGRQWLDDGRKQVSLQAAQVLRHGNRDLVG